MADDLTYLWAPITKMDNSTREIEGPISGPNNQDLDGQIVDLNWLRGAVGPWMAFGNIRLQHDPKRPVGKAKDLDMTKADGVPWIRAKIVDDDAWHKVSEGVLSGFSVGIKNARVIKDGTAPNGRIVGGALCEVSIVDHPANQEAKFAICKGVGVGEWLDCQTGLVLEALDKGSLLRPLNAQSAGLPSSMPPEGEGPDRTDDTAEGIDDEDDANELGRDGQGPNGLNIGRGSQMARTVKGAYESNRTGPDEMPNNFARRPIEGAQDEDERGEDGRNDNYGEDADLEGIPTAASGHEPKRAVKPGQKVTPTALSGGKNNGQSPDALDTRKGVLDGEERGDLEDSQFAVPSKRKLPIHDASHARNAAARLPLTKGLTPGERAEAKRRIDAALEHFGKMAVPGRLRKDAQTEVTTRDEGDAPGFDGTEGGDNESSDDEAEEAVNANAWNQPKGQGQLPKKNSKAKIQVKAVGPDGDDDDGPTDPGMGVGGPGASGAQPGGFDSADDGQAMGGDEGAGLDTGSDGAGLGSSGVDEDGGGLGMGAGAAPTPGSAGVVVHDHHHYHGKAMHTHPHMHGAGVDPESDEDHHPGDPVNQEGQMGHSHCPTCGSDGRICGCQQGMVGKAAKDFYEESALPYDDLPRFDADDANYRNETAIDDARGSIDRYQREVSGGKWNPNFPDTSVHADDADEDGHIGAADPDIWQWRGVSSNAVKGVRGMSQEELLRSVQEQIEKAIQDNVVSLVRGEIMKMLGGEEAGLLTKGAKLESVKEAFSDFIINSAEGAAAEVVSQLEDRLQRVEKAAAPSKGYAIAVEKNFQLNRPEREAVEEDLNAVLSKMSEEDKLRFSALVIQKGYRA